MDKLAIMKKILLSLINRNMWQHKHTEETNLRKCLPKHLRGEKVANEAIVELVKQGFLLYKISTHEKHFSLNIEKKKEMYTFLKENN